jgi:hypothetical protein
MNRDLDLLISFLQPIKILLLDDTVSEIMGNPNGQWWFERKGRLEHAEVVSKAKRKVDARMDRGCVLYGTLTQMQQSLGRYQKDAASGRQLCTGAPAQEQRRAYAVFELFDLSAE